MIFFSLYPSKKHNSSKLTETETNKINMKNRILKNTYIIYVIMVFICFQSFSNHSEASDAIPGDVIFRALGGALWALLYTAFAFGYRKLRSQV